MKAMKYKPCSRCVLGNLSDFSIFEHKSYMARTVLLQNNGSFKWPESKIKVNVLLLIKSSLLKFLGMQDLAMSCRINHYSAQTHAIQQPGTVNCLC